MRSQIVQLVGWHHLVVIGLPLATNPPIITLRSTTKSLTLQYAPNGFSSIYSFDNIVKNLIRMWQILYTLITECIKKFSYMYINNVLLCKIATLFIEGCKLCNIPYIANHARWKSFTVFTDRSVPWNFSSNIGCAIGFGHARLLCNRESFPAN